MKSFNIKAPRIVGRSEVIQFNDVEIKKTKNKIELDDDVIPAISIIRKFEDMGFTKREGVERAVQLSYYIETKLGLDCFKIYTRMLEYIIKNSGVKKLEQDLDSIKNGNVFNITEDPKARIMNTFMEVTDKFLTELLEPEPEAEPEKIINEKPFLVKFYEAYKMLENPVKYKIDKLREKEARKKELNREALEVIREALG